MKKFTIAERLLLLTTILGLLHHVDHVLRVDHSGWPFIPLVTPFTYSLFVYPVILAALLAKPKPWFRFWAIMTIFVFVQTSHIFIEPASHIYTTWVHGSNLDRAAGLSENLLGIHSQALAIIAVIVQVALSVSLISTIVALYREARSPK